MVLAGAPTRTALCVPRCAAAGGFRRRSRRRSWSLRRLASYAVPVSRPVAVWKLFIEITP